MPARKKTSMHIPLLTIGALVTLLLTLGCTTPTDYNWGSPPTVEFGASDCEPSNVQPSLCAWTLSSDAVVVGEVQNVQMTETPMFVRYVDGGSNVVESETEALELCESTPHRGIRFSVRVIDKLHASDRYSVSTDDVIDVHLGVEGLTWWSSQPLAGDDLTITGWSGEGEVRPGDVLGLNLSLDKRGDATMGTNSIFVEEDGQVNFREDGRQCAPYEGAPVDEASGSYQQFRAGVLACTPDATSDEELGQRARSRDDWDVPFSQGSRCPWGIETSE